MSTKLLLLLCLIGHVFANELPDVDCLVVHLQYVHCVWNKQETPDVNYTFYSWFDGEEKTECTTYLMENNTNIGCNPLYREKTNRFRTFHTNLTHGNRSLLKEHNLKQKVKLNPPANLTLHIGPDSNLWCYWNQTATKCVENEVRYRVNNKNWDLNPVIAMQHFCINLPSNHSVYELQVRSKIERSCGESLFWSDWTEPVFWGSNNSKPVNSEPEPMSASMSPWVPVMYAVGILTLIILVMMMLHHERFLFITVVPKPRNFSHDIEDWLQLSKGFKEKSNYNERACIVSEYCQVPQSDSKSSDGSTSSVTTDQTDCSASIHVEDLDLSPTCSVSTSPGRVSTDEGQGFV